MALRTLNFDKVDITGGFWKEKQEMVKNATLQAVHDRFYESGRFSAFKLQWKEGEPGRPHIFWDSDVAKWIEGASYILKKERDPKIEAIVDEVVEDIARGRTEDGYFNSYYLLFEPEKRFTERSNHELYCAGHLLEAAIAYDEATGKSEFLSMMKDYMHLIKRVFMEEQSAGFRTPGHEEIELALVKLYDYTGEREWLELASFFIEERGQREEKEAANFGSIQTQSHMPVRQMETAEGHAVRAGYLFSAVADMANRTDDAELKAVCERIFTNITERKMYITGAIGSSYTAGEAFEEDYRLPNDVAYAESCAALSLALFARRAGTFAADSRYGDTVERVIYNGFLSGVSLDGVKFFYENAQEIDLCARERIRTALGKTKNMHLPITERVRLFSCSCCPPNVVRYIPSIGNLLYSCSEDTVFVDQYMESTAALDGLTLTQKTAYPYDGTVQLTLQGGDCRVAFRIPGWCDVFRLSVNGAAASYTVERGYAYLDVRDGDTVTLAMQMQARVVRADPHVSANRGLSAVTYGPFVMCMEGIDNGGWLGDVCLTDAPAVRGFDDELGTLTLSVPAYREAPAAPYSATLIRTPFTAKLIPYYAFANRGETDMRIWVPVR